jgi:hypothetical protein
MCRNWLINQKGYVVKFRRTALNPIWHKLAVSASGTDDYPPFAQIGGEGIKTVKELEDECEKEMSKVRRNTTKKSARVGSVAHKKASTKKKVEEVK